MKIAEHINKEDLDLLNSNKGLKHLLSQKEIDYKSVLKKLKYERRMKELQIELIKMPMPATMAIVNPGICGGSDKRLTAS